MANSGRKEKYTTCVQPYLEEIKKKIREGVTEEAIAQSLGVSMASFSNYKLRYPELAEALKRDKGAEVLEKLVNAGITNACGQWIEEERITIQLDDEGNPTRRVKEIVKRYLPPNPTLNIYYTKQYGKEQGFTSDPLEHELKKAKLDFEKAQASVKDWTKYD